jgi:hypothetical protein
MKAFVLTFVCFFVGTKLICPTGKRMRVAMFSRPLLDAAFHEVTSHTCRTRTTKKGVEVSVDDAKA